MLELRSKGLLPLTAAVLLPFLLLGGLGVTAVLGLSGMARTQTRQAIDQELRRRLTTRVQERARAEDAVFQGVLSQAVSLGRYVKWYYDFPEHRPAPGYLRGGSDLLETPEGHRVNRQETPVGVFVSRQTVMTPPVWEEVGLLSFADPLLVSIGESTRSAERTWVISASRILRNYPNQQFGQPGSPVGPDYDPTGEEPFRAAAPERNPHQLPVWTAPYRDPITGQLMITAAAPVYDTAGAFRAVTGVDMLLTGVLQDVLSVQAAPGEYALLLDQNGQVISGQQEGVAAQLQGVTEPGLITYDGRLAAYAPLPSTGWVLVLVAPSDAVEAAAAPGLAAIRRLEVLFLTGGALVLPIALALVGYLALRSSQQLAREASVEERNRLAREIHDTIAQGLTGIVVHLETAEACLGDDPDPQACKHLERARQLARESLQEARRSVWNLRPSAVEGSGLPRSLEQLGAGMRQDGFACEVSAAPVPALPTGTEDALYRVCQEALANVRRHSGASTCWIRLRTQGTALVLAIQDDGRGFDPASNDGPRPEGGYGLWAMQERLEHVGGSLQVESAPGRGTVVRATVPLQQRR